MRNLSDVVIARSFIIEGFIFERNWNNQETMTDTKISEKNRSGDICREFSDTASLILIINHIDDTWCKIHNFLKLYNNFYTKQIDGLWNLYLNNLI